MKVLVLGAGVVGSAAAYFLAANGHQVEVIDRQPAAGLETSFANGGQVSASHATPWASPQTPLKALRWLGRDDAPLVFRWFRRDPDLWRWGLRFLANCTPSACRHNTGHTVRLALYSRETLKALREEFAAAGDDSLNYDSLQRGILHLFRQPAAFEEQCRSARLMEEWGLPQQILGREELVQQEPALRHVAPQLAGGLLSGDDESGDAHKFTQAIAAAAARLGAVFHFGQVIERIDRDHAGITAVQTVQQTFRADAYVLCLGSWSPLFSRQLGISLPIYPAKGYSVTLPLAAGERQAPTVSITDDEHKMVYSRLGDRLRAAGTAELAGWDTTLYPARAGQILRLAREMFPHAGDYGQASLWCGLRPKTPDSLPYLGTSPLRNLYLNTGHGTLGWTMSVGSGRLLAELISGRQPELDLSAYRVGR